jgi:hypothetical protein
MSIVYRCRGVCFIVLFLAGAAVGRSQGVGRLGGEFQIVGLIPNDQVLPAVSLTATGGALAFYNQGLGIYGSVLGAQYTGSTISSVNKTATGDQVRPGVAELRNGNTIFVWQSRVLGTPDIFARLGKGTNFYTNDLRLNNYITDQQVDPAVAALPDGGAMVVWASYGQDGSLWGVYARKVMANGTLAGAQEFLVNQYTIGNQRKPAVCALAGGNVVFAWVSEGERFYSSRDIYARVFTPAGVPVTQEFLVNSATNMCAEPALAPLNNGGFTAAWSQKDTVVANGWDVWGRAFNAHGAPTVPAFRINGYLFGDQYKPKLASAPSGVMAVWTSMGEDGDREGVYGRFLLGGDKVSGDEFLVNTTTVSQQLEPVVGWNGVDRFLVVWTSFAGTTGFDLFGQMYILTP